MEIRETRQRNLKLLEEEIQVSKKGIQFVKNNLNPLGDEPDQEEEGKGIDPARFMTRREEKEWNRLSGHKQAQFIKSGIREAGTHQPREAAEKISSVFREGNIQQELAGRKDYAGHMYGPAKNPFAGRNVKESRVTRADQIQKERRSASGTEKQHGPPETPRAQERREKGAEHFSPVGKAPPEISGSQGSFSTVNSAAFTGTKTEGMAAASGSASSKNAGKGGAGIAAAAAKKNGRGIPRSTGGTGNGSTAGTTEITDRGIVWNAAGAGGIRGHNPYNGACVPCGNRPPYGEHTCDRFAGNGRVDPSADRRALYSGSDHCFHLIRADIFKLSRV